MCHLRVKTGGRAAKNRVEFCFLFNDAIRTSATAHFVYQRLIDLQMGKTAYGTRHENEMA